MRKYIKDNIYYINKMDYNKIYKLFRSFIDDIIIIFPEYKERLYGLYDDILIEDSLTDNNQKIDEFLINIKKYSEYISNEDNQLFECDPIIIPNISFKVIWDSNISNNTRDNIWKYLQTFCMMKISFDSNDKINEMIESIQNNERIKDKKTFSEMKQIKKLNNLIQKDKNNDDENNDNETDGDETNDEMFSNISNILESTNIGKIAKEITDEINIEEMINPESDGNIEDIFKGDNIGNLFSIINDKIGNKLTSNEINKDELVNEAGNICSEMQNNNLFNSLFGDNLKNINLNPNSMNNSQNNSNPTRERLQRKLKKKQKQNINVKKLEN